MTYQRDQIQLIASGIRFPEGPAFTADGTLWCVEKEGASLIHFTGGGFIRVPTGGNPNGLTVDGHGQLWFCDSGLNAIRVYKPATQVVETVLSHLHGKPLNMPNDLAFDDAGNLLFTCPGAALDSTHPYVCCYTSGGQLRVITDDLQYPNGLAFTPDGHQLVIAETAKHRVWIGDWQPTATAWQNPRVFAHTGGPVGPDGLAFDDNGNLYVAVYGTGSIHVFNPTGKLIDKILLPGKNPTNCAFDPSGKLGLVITEAEKGQLLSLNRQAKGCVRNPLITQRT